MAGKDAARFQPHYTGQSLSVTHSLSEPSFLPVGPFITDLRRLWSALPECTRLQFVRRFASFKGQSIAGETASEIRGISRRIARLGRVAFEIQLMLGLVTEPGALGIAMGCLNGGAVSLNDSTEERPSMHVQPCFILVVRGSELQINRQRLN